MIGRTLGGSTVAVIQGSLVTVVCLIAGFRPAHLIGIPLALGFMVLIALLFAALGMAIGSGLQDMQGFQLIMNFLVMPIYFLSGALFPLNDAHNVLKYITRADPLSYGIDGMRIVLGASNAAFVPANRSACPGVRGRDTACVWCMALLKDRDLRWFDRAVSKHTRRFFMPHSTCLLERGIDATSMDAIAQSSGVSKATIYNHWADKEALLLEVMLMVNGLDREPEDVDSGDVQRDLATVLTRKPPDKFDAARNRMTPSLIAYSAVHPEFGKAWRHRVMEPPRQCLKRILRRGIARGVFPHDLDLEAAMALAARSHALCARLSKGSAPQCPRPRPLTAAGLLARTQSGPQTANREGRNQESGEKK